MPSSTENKKIVIAGGSGFLGVSLAHYLVERGYTVAILSRSAAAASGPWRQRSWDGRTIGAWREELNEATGLVNLAGRSVSCIKTPDHQDEILRSRVESTLALYISSTSSAVWIDDSSPMIIPILLVRFAYPSKFLVSR